jgi:hypothetical protein
MLPLAAKTELIALPVANRAFMIDMGDHPTLILCLQVIPAAIDPSAGRRDGGLILGDNGRLRIRAFNGDNSLSFDHLQRERSIIPSAVRSKEPPPIIGTVCQDSLFFLYSRVKELCHEFFDPLHKVMCASHL